MLRDPVGRLLQGGISLVRVLIFLVLISGWSSRRVNSLQVVVMVTTKMRSAGRRRTLRDVFGQCTAHVAAEHLVEQLFFLGGVEDVPAEVLSVVAAESEEFGDLVFVGGPDSDPPVPRDVTYVLDRPTSRGYRLAYGTKWLADNRPTLDYVMYLDDDSFLSIPKLLVRLEEHSSVSLAMGFVMETPLDNSQVSICDVCRPCERCLKDDALGLFCKQFPEMSLGGCLATLHQCQLHDDDGTADLAACVLKTHREILRVSAYFGSSAAPRWFLGMGWVFGRRIINYVAANVDVLKKRGAADVQVGFWLAPLEDIDWVDMKDGSFHDYPEPGSTFAAGCSERTVQATPL